MSNRYFHTKCRCILCLHNVCLRWSLLWGCSRFVDPELRILIFIEVVDPCHKTIWVAEPLVLKSSHGISLSLPRCNSDDLVAVLIYLGFFLSKLSRIFLLSWMLDCAFATFFRSVRVVEVSIIDILRMRNRPPQPAESYNTCIVKK